MRIKIIIGLVALASFGVGFSIGALVFSARPLIIQHKTAFDDLFATAPDDDFVARELGYPNFEAFLRAWAQEQGYKDYESYLLITGEPDQRKP